MSSNLGKITRLQPGRSQHVSRPRASRGELPPGLYESMTDKTAKRRAEIVFGSALVFVTLAIAAVLFKLFFWL